MKKFTEQEKAQTVLQVLLELKEGGPLFGECGICFNVDAILDAEDESEELSRYWEESRESVFENWDDPAASGDFYFPIIGDYGAATSIQMWVAGEYAEARWRLVDHLIEHYTSLSEEE